MEHQVSDFEAVATLNGSAYNGSSASNVIVVDSEIMQVALVLSEMRLNFAQSAVGATIMRTQPAIDMIDVEQPIDLSTAGAAITATTVLLSDEDGEELTTIGAAATLCLMLNNKHTAAEHVGAAVEGTSMNGDSGSDMSHSYATCSNGRRASDVSSGGETTTRVAATASFPQCQFDEAMRYMMMKRSNAVARASDSDEDMDGQLSPITTEEIGRFFADANDSDGPQNDGVRSPDDSSDGQTVMANYSSTSSSSPTNSNTSGSSLIRHSQRARSRHLNNNKQFVYQPMVRLTRAERTAQTAAKREAIRQEAVAKRKANKAAQTARKQRAIGDREPRK